MSIYVPGKLTLRKEFQVQDYMWLFPEQYGLWTPAEITTALWLDAADSSTITESGGAVSEWRDKSGNGRHTTQSGAARPTFSSTGFNSRPGVLFNGSSQFLEISNARSLTQNIGSLSMFFSFKAAANNPIQQAFAGFSTSGPTTARFVAVVNTNNTFSLTGRRLDTDSFASASSAGQNTGSEGIIAFYRNWTAGGGSIFYNGGTADPLDATFGSSGNTSNTQSDSDPRIGTNPPGGIWLNGALSKVIIILGLPDIATRQRIEGWMAHADGLTAVLPSDHPYKTVGPTP